MRAIGIGEIRIEPHDPSRERWADQIAGCGRVEVERTVQIHGPDIEPVALLQDVLNLGIRLAPPERRRDIDQCQLRRGEPERDRGEPGDELGHECARSMSRAAEFHDVERAVLGLDDGGKRSALAQRLDVTGGGQDAHGE